MTYVLVLGVGDRSRCLSARSSLARRPYSGEARFGGWLAEPVSHHLSINIRLRVIRPHQAGDRLLLWRVPYVRVTLPDRLPSSIAVPTLGRPTRRLSCGITIIKTKDFSRTSLVTTVLSERRQSLRSASCCPTITAWIIVLTVHDQCRATSHNDLTLRKSPASPQSTNNHLPSMDRPHIGPPETHTHGCDA